MTGVRKEQQEERRQKQRQETRERRFRPGLDFLAFKSESRPFAGLRGLRLGERHGQTRLATDETAKQSLFYCWRFVGDLLVIVGNLSSLGVVLFTNQRQL